MPLKEWNNFFKRYISNFNSDNYLSWVTHYLVYLGRLPQFNETVELSTLTHWFDLSAKAKVLNTKLAPTEVWCKGKCHHSVILHSMRSYSYLKAIWGWSYIFLGYLWYYNNVEILPSSLLISIDTLLLILSTFRSLNYYSIMGSMNYFGILWFLRYWEITCWKGILET